MDRFNTIILSTTIVILIRGCIADKKWYGNKDNKMEYLYVVADEEMTCGMAEEKCKENDAHLTSILSNEENNFIYTQNPFPKDKYEDSFWIGLQNENPVLNLTWQWLDNSPLEWNNWKSMQPDEVVDFEVCAVMYELQWFDYAGTRKKYICKRANQCLSLPCHNNGNCTRLQGGYYKCQCPPQFNGTQCEIENLCISSPCLNNATCENANGGVACMCLHGFSGIFCENKENMWLASALFWPITGACAALVLLVLVICIVVTVIVCKHNRKRRDSDGVELDYIGFRRESVGLNRQSGIPYEEIDTSQMTLPSTVSSINKKKLPISHNYVNTSLKNAPITDTYASPNKNKTKFQAMNNNNCDNDENKQLVDINSPEYSLETLPASTYYSKEQAPLVRNPPRVSSVDDDYDYCEGEGPPDYAEASPIDQSNMPINTNSSIKDGETPPLPKQPKRIFSGYEGVYLPQSMENSVPDRVSHANVVGIPRTTIQSYVPEEVSNNRDRVEIPGIIRSNVPSRASGYEGVEIPNPIQSHIPQSRVSGYEGVELPRNPSSHQIPVSRRSGYEGVEMPSKNLK